ncbi:SDR family NAD(P)-dependent oxidoreductase [Nocardioides jensenii]|uniref:SDR family NAD(P)-dependent oxidoreductase n=1 Tax=Nocardioides jensenii TaxID=1843 RepID=UPI0008309876|nr:glucose 1-dehydrogenase [Nocardioides jensenii]
MSDAQRPVAIVTGAGRGIGRSIALRLAEAGYAVEASDRTGSMAEATAALDTSGALTARELDVTDRDATYDGVRDVFGKHGRLDLVVNNAMWMRYGALEGINARDLDRMFDVGVKGPLWLSQAVAEPMAASGGGAIVNIASVAALLGTPASAGYAAVKGAVVSMTRQLAVDLGPRGIRVNAVAPGTIRTEGQTAAMTQESVAYREQRAPLGRLGDPQDVADAVIFLGGPNAAFVTGQVLVVDGGITAAM